MAGLTAATEVHRGLVGMVVDRTAIAVKGAVRVTLGTEITTGSRGGKLPRAMRMVGSSVVTASASKVVILPIATDATGTGMASSPAFIDMDSMAAAIMGSAIMANVTAGNSATVDTGMATAAENITVTTAIDIGVVGMGMAITATAAENISMVTTAIDIGVVGMGMAITATASENIMVTTAAEVDTPPMAAARWAMANRDITATAIGASSPRMKAIMAGDHRREAVLLPWARGSSATARQGLQVAVQEPTSAGVAHLRG